MFTASVVGLGLAPLAVGYFSDLMQPRFGPESLRWSLVIMQLSAIWGVSHIWLASRSFTEELRERPASQ